MDLHPPTPVPLALEGFAELSTPIKASVRAGTKIEVATARPTMLLTLTKLDPGSWVIFELPGFTTAAAGAEQSSLDALRSASATSYYKGQDALWVKGLDSRWRPVTAAPSPRPMAVTGRG